MASFFLAQSISSPIPGVYWGEIILLTATALALVWQPTGTVRIHGLHICFLVLYVSYLIITLATACFQPAFSLYDFLIRAIRWGTYIMCGAFLAFRIDFEKLRKIVITLAVLVAVFLIIQVIVYQLTGRVIRFRVGNKILGCSVEGRYRNGVQYSRIYRFSSIFSEPAHFAYYVTIGLVLLLFYRRTTQVGLWELLAGGVLIIAMVLSTSTYGLALIAIVGLIYLYLYLLHTRNAANALLVIVGIVSCLGLLMLGMRGTSTYSYLLSKLGTIGSTNRTTFIWQGDWDFPPLMTWLGCGVGNEEYYFHHYFNYDLPYINSVSISFLYCGIVGIGLMILFYLVSWLFCDRNARIFLLLIGTMALFSTMFFGSLISLFGTIMVAGERWFDSFSGGEA